jgi:hypothetical protein
LCRSEARPPSFLRVRPGGGAVPVRFPRESTQALIVRGVVVDCEIVFDDNSGTTYLVVDDRPVEDAPRHVVQR